MSTPIKSASSLLLHTRLISPRSPTLLSPLGKRGQSTPKKELKRCLEYSNKFQKTNNVVKNSIQIKVTQEFNNEDSLNIDSPHKTELLNYGLNRYDLLYLLGKGSFGTVIKGNYHGNTIAVKIIKLNPSSNYVNEANARHFVHENIIRILDIITSQKYALVMMEYEEKSRNLQCVIDDVDLCLNKKIITKCVKDIARGLRYCHENDVLHLDIKPKNILMVNNNVCKICDFGNSMKTSNIKEIYQFQGTIAYTAPEILKGNTPSTKSDIYSLGILIWQMINRKYPYENFNSQVVIYKVVKFNFRPYLNKNDFLSKLCCNCWDENPDKRPGAAEICNVL